jgi:uncharacterized protein (TIGR00730 family)
VPGFLEEKTENYPHLTKIVRTRELSDRKDEMITLSDAFVAVPGGIGTMDELFETMVLSKLGRYEGRILVLNLDGFYDPLRALLEHFVREGMTARTDVDRVVFCDSTDALAALL